MPSSSVRSNIRVIKSVGAREVSLILSIIFSSIIKTPYSCYECIIAGLMHLIWCSNPEVEKTSGLIGLFVHKFFEFGQSVIQRIKSCFFFTVRIHNTVIMLSQNSFARKTNKIVVIFIFTEICIFSSNPYYS